MLKRIPECLFAPGLGLKFCEGIVSYLERFYWSKKKKKCFPIIKKQIEPYGYQTMIKVTNNNSEWSSVMHYFFNNVHNKFINYTVNPHIIYILLKRNYPGGKVVYGRKNNNNKIHVHHDKTDLFFGTFGIQNKMFRRDTVRIIERQLLSEARPEVGICVTQTEICRTGRVTGEGMSMTHRPTGIGTASVGDVCTVTRLGTEPIGELRGRALEIPG